MPTLTVNAFREQTLDLLTQGRVYEFIPRAEAYLEQVPEDHLIRLRTVQEYLKLGLIQPACDLLNVELKGTGFPQELASIRESLGRMQARPVPWSDFAGRYEANLGALEARGSDTGPIRRAWNSDQERFQLWFDRSDVQHVRMLSGDGKWRWIPFFGDHGSLERAKPLPEGIKALQPGPYLFEGVDLGHYFARIYDETLDSFLGFSCALFIVEPDSALLALVFHLHDWSGLLADTRVHIFAGENCVNRLRTTFEQNLNLPLPTHAFTMSRFRPGCQPPAVQAVQELGKQRERAIRESYADLESRYAGRDVKYWAGRLSKALSGRDEPLRILAVVSTHTSFLQYSMEDVRRALEELGHKCMVLMEDTHYEVPGPLTYHKAIRELEPDLFFIIDHLRHELTSIVPTNLPILTWDQDQLPHVFTADNMRKVPPTDFLVGYSKPLWVRAGCNPRQFLNARIPTSPERFSGDPLTAEEIERYTCDVSYVSHASQTPEQFHQEERRQYGDPQLVRLLDCMYELLPPLLARHRVVHRELPVMVLEEACARVGVQLQDEQIRQRLMWWYLWRLGDRMFRHEALGWVAQWAEDTGRSFRIYGNGWDKHPTLSAFAAGPAQNGRELLCVHRASKINLQLMPMGFIHQRALDGLASGGFFLTRKAPLDIKGGLLKRLVARLKALNITDTRGMLTSPDAELKSLLVGYLGEWLPRYQPDDPNVYSDVLGSAALDYPDEVFPRYSQIVFDNATEFAAIANHFLSEENERRSIAEEMRQVVVERFTYKAAVKRFLDAMSTYLSEQAH